MIFFKDKRIALVCNSLEVYAGVEKRTFELACFLRDRGYQVEVVSLRTLGKVGELYRKEGISVHHIPAYRYTDRIVPSPWNLLRLGWFFLHRRYGVIVGVQPPAHYFCRIAALPPLGRRLFAMERLSLEDRSSKFRKLDRILQRWTRRILCVGDLMRDQLIDGGVSPEKILVVNNGVRIPEATFPNETLRQQIGNAFVFGFVGLLEERKRPRLLVEAFARIAREWPESRLVFVGNGPQRQELEELARARGVADSVIFTGEQRNPHALYPLFHAFVFPSVLEGFGSVWAEAMMHGLPVICADVRPMNDYVRHETNGLLAAADDLDSLEAQMRRLLADAGLRRWLGEAGRAFAREHFDQGRQLRKLEATFRARDEVV